MFFKSWLTTCRGDCYALQVADELSLGVELAAARQELADRAADITKLKTELEVAHQQLEHCRGLLDSYRHLSVTLKFTALTGTISLGLFI